MKPSPQRSHKLCKGCICFAFQTPYSSRGRREGEGQARSGGVFLGAFRRAERRGASRIIGGDPVNRRPGERVRHGWRTLVFRAKQESVAKKAKLGSKRRVRGEADQGKGPVDLCPAERARYGRRAPGLQARARTAKRSKARVQARHREWGLPGPPETTRRAGDPLYLRAMAQAQMALGTLAETKVPRLPGRDPANVYRR